MSEIKEIEIQPKKPNIFLRLLLALVAAFDTAVKNAGKIHDSFDHLL